MRKPDFRIISYRPQAKIATGNTEAKPATLVYGQRASNLSTVHYAIPGTLGSELLSGIYDTLDSTQYGTTNTDVGWSSYGWSITTAGKAVSGNVSFPLLASDTDTDVNTAGKFFHFTTNYYAHVPSINAPLVVTICGTTLISGIRFYEPDYITATVKASATYPEEYFEIYGSGTVSNDYVRDSVQNTSLKQITPLQAQNATTSASVERIGTINCVGNTQAVKAEGTGVAEKAYTVYTAVGNTQAIKASSTGVAEKAYTVYTAVGNTQAVKAAGTGVAEKAYTVYTAVGNTQAIKATGTGTAEKAYTVYTAVGNTQAVKATGTGVAELLSAAVGNTQAIKATGTGVAEKAYTVYTAVGNIQAVKASSTGIAEKAYTVYTAIGNTQAEKSSISTITAFVSANVYEISPVVQAKKANIIGLAEYIATIATGDVQAEKAQVTVAVDYIATIDAAGNTQAKNAEVTSSTERVFEAYIAAGNTQAKKATIIGVTDVLNIFEAVGDTQAQKAIASGIAENIYDDFIEVGYEYKYVSLARPVTYTAKVWSTTYTAKTPNKNWGK